MMEKTEKTLRGYQEIKMEHIRKQVELRNEIIKIIGYGISKRLAEQRADKILSITYDHWTIPHVMGKAM